MISNLHVIKRLFIECVSFALVKVGQCVTTGRVGEIFCPICRMRVNKFKKV